MHASSLENMAKCYRRYVSNNFIESRDTVTVLDIGSADVNGSYRSIFNHEKFRYIGADLQPAPGVDIILTDNYKLPFEADSIDIVISGQTLEHSEFFWVLFLEIIRVLHPAGLLFIIAPSAGPSHRYPVDCYRFYPDAYAALARYANCVLIDSWLDERGPWKDLVGVFAKQAIHDRANNQLAFPPESVQSSTWPTDNPVETETTKGQEPYLQVLSRLHILLNPGLYLEIGVRDGNSLGLARTKSIGIDPNTSSDLNVSACSKIYCCSSDDFFDEFSQEALEAEIDLALIDGMHLFEFALRDFMNIERHSRPTTLVVIDDIFPNHPVQCERSRRSRVWTGDIWKISHCLRTYRPDLTLIPLDAAPTGLLLVAGLDAHNNTLWDNYNTIIRSYNNHNPPCSLNDALSRTGAINPKSLRVRWLLRRLRQLKASKATIIKAQKAAKRFHVHL